MFIECVWFGMSCGIKERFRGHNFTDFETSALKIIPLGVILSSKVELFLDSQFFFYFVEDLNDFYDWVA